MFQVQKALSPTVEAPLASMSQFNALTLPTISNLAQVQQLVPLPDTLAAAATTISATGAGAIPKGVSSIAGAARRAMFGTTEE